MKLKRILGFVFTFLLFAITVGFTYFVTSYDVQLIGAGGTEIGFATLNSGFFQKFNYPQLYDVTTWLGVFAIAVVFVFFCTGALQLVKNKGFKGVNSRIYLLAIIYVLLAGIYIVFENYIINYRPVLMDGKLQASYPSSHVMLVVTVMFTGLISINQMAKNKAFKVICNVVFSAVAVAMIVGRLICGVHWLTDIVGGVLISTTLIMLYYSLTLCVKKTDKEINQKNMASLGMSENNINQSIKTNSLTSTKVDEDLNNEVSLEKQQRIIDDILSNLDTSTIGQIEETSDEEKVKKTRISNTTARAKKQTIKSGVSLANPEPMTIQEALSKTNKTKSAEITQQKKTSTRKTTKK